MDDQERDEILYRLDERTERVDEHLSRLERRIGAVENVADDAYDLADKNERQLGAFTKVAVGVGTFLTGLVSAISAKITGIL